MANETGQTLSQVYNILVSSPTLTDSIRILDALWKLLSAEIRKEINKIRQESGETPKKTPDRGECSWHMIRYIIMVFYMMMIQLLMI